MAEIYDDSGNLIGSVPISENQEAILAGGANVTVQYHVPQLLRGLLGGENGSFVLHGGDRITTGDKKTVQSYIALQERIRAARNG